MVHLTTEIYETAKGEFPREWSEVFAYGHAKTPTYDRELDRMRPETDADDEWYICDYTKQYGFSKTKGTCRFMDIKYWYYQPAVENL